jgi:uncharacterized protein YndB with AHSA1/START domain
MSLESTRPTDRDGTFAATDAGYELRFERRFGHPVELVWDALTRPEQIAEWWLPFAADIELELVEGGTYVVRTSDPHAEELALEWTVLRAEPPRLFEHTHEQPGAVVRWELEPDGDGCRLTLTQTGPNPEWVLERQYLSGLHTSLERLASLLDGHAIAWSWPRFEEHRDRYAANGLGAR